MAENGLRPDMTDDDVCRTEITMLRPQFLAGGDPAIYRLVIHHQTTKHPEETTATYSGPVLRRELSLAEAIDLLDRWLSEGYPIEREPKLCAACAAPREDDTAC